MKLVLNIASRTAQPPILLFLFYQHLVGFLRKLRFNNNTIQYFRFYV